MDLSINVSLLPWLAERAPESAQRLYCGLDVVNRTLVERGFSPYEEPLSPPPPELRVPLGAIPSSWLLYLRRVYIKWQFDPDWKATPLPEGADLEFEAAAEIVETMNSHLLCHSHKDGYYLPVAFPYPILFDERPPELIGLSLCSSYGLMGELIMLAPALGIELGNGLLSDAEAQRIDALAQECGDLHRELSAWLLLFECARLSIAHKTAVVFT